MAGSKAVEWPLRDRCSYCGEVERGTWLPVPPYTVTDWGRIVGHAEEMFVGWDCLSNVAVPREEVIADICQRADQSRVNRRAV